MKGGGRMATRSQLLAKSLGIEDPKRAVSQWSPQWSTKWYQVLWGIFVTLVCIVIYTQIGLVIVDGDSMNGTLKHGEWYIMKKHAPIERFNIVVLNERVYEGAPDKYIVKRVIGLPGDVIEVEKGVMKINGQVIEEYYVQDALRERFDKIPWHIEVPEGRLFVLGDNRDHSQDSRHVGSFEQSSVMGTLVR